MKKILVLITGLLLIFQVNAGPGGNGINPKKGTIIDVEVGTGKMKIKDNTTGEVVSARHKPTFVVGDGVTYILITRKRPPELLVVILPGKD